MDPITVSTNISRPREEIFEYLANIANHPEFCDHYLVDWHLTREDPYGEGAGARFRLKQPLNRFSWADITLVDVQPPFRIVERGRGGKYNRIKSLGVWEIHLGSGGVSRVQYTYETEVHMPSDRLREMVFGRMWTRRKAARALRRLRSILEDGKHRGSRVAIAAR